MLNNNLHSLPAQDLHIKFSGSSDTANNIKHTIKDLMTNDIIQKKTCFCHFFNLVDKDVLKYEDDIAKNDDLKDNSLKDIMKKCRFVNLVPV